MNGRPWLALQTETATPHIIWHYLADCLRWLFDSDHKDAIFWRAQVCAIKPLRDAKDGMSKIARIDEAWQRAEDKTGGKPETPLDPEILAWVAARKQKGGAQ